MKETVLLVDDSRVVQSYFNTLMNPTEFRLLVADNAKDAKALIRQEKNIDAAIVDLNLPDSTKGEVVDFCIKKKIPTIVLTGSRNKDVRRQMGSKEIIDYMQKNTRDDFANVVSLIRQLRNNKKTKILIVDDSKTFRLYLKKLLLLHQFIVIEAENGKEALLKIGKNPDISMVLTDYEMPKMDGLKLIYQIRKTHTMYDLPIIVLSAHDDGYKIADSLKAGANDYLHKPYKKEEFFSRVYMNMRTGLHMNRIKEQQTLIEQYKKAIDETSIVSKADRKGKITYVNNLFCDVTEYSVEELLGQTHNIMRHPDSSVEVSKELWKDISNKEIWHGIIKNRKKNGDSYTIDTTIVPILDTKGGIQEFISIGKDITQLLEQNNTIQKQYTDTLTQLPNRLKLIQDLEEMEFASLVIINIDSFHEINSFYGYDIADRLLVEVGKKIKNFSSDTHKTYKLPIDEYAMLGENSEIEEKIYISDLLEQISGKSFMIGEHEVYLHFSVGIYSGTTGHFVKADIALQQAKVKKTNVCAYGELDDVNEVQFNNLKWIKKLHNAITENRIKPFYQPIVNNKNGQTDKYEALVRMMDIDGTAISPSFFLEIAKKTKLYEKLTRAVFEQTIVLAKKCQASFSINLTVTDLKNTLLMNSFCEEIKFLEIADYIIFEIVESEELESTELFEMVETIKKCGIKISIDDFGTGYSNFDYLIKLKADFVKIDGSIIKNILTDSNSALIVKTIVNIAKEIGAKTIAEFVENEAIYEKVKELGIDYSQGYYFSAPLENIILEEV